MAPRPQRVRFWSDVGTQRASREVRASRDKMRLRFNVSAWDVRIGAVQDRHPGAEGSAADVTGLRHCPERRMSSQL
jgi:hypothetical protein